MINPDFMRVINWHTDPELGVTSIADVAEFYPQDYAKMLKTVTAWQKALERDCNIVIEGYAAGDEFKTLERWEVVNGVPKGYKKMRTCVRRQGSDELLDLAKFVNQEVDRWVTRTVVPALSVFPAKT